MKIIKIFIIFLSVNSVMCCSTFDNTEMETILNDQTLYKLRLTGCIERIAFYQDKIQRVIVQINITNQKVPNLKKDAVRNMAQLRTFIIKNSGLNKINPGIFRNVPRLKKIEFYENKLNEIPRGAFNATSLEEISLHNNKINFIETNAFSSLENLKTLNLSSNNLDSMNRNWFYDLPILTTVDFSSNQIRNVPTKIFIHARSVKNIYLDNNDITDIQKAAFEGLTNLNYLGLKHNLLKRIHENSFPKFQFIENLCINSNRFSYLTESFLNKIKIKTLNLDGNPWQCGCYRKILGHLYKNDGRIVPSIECQNYDVPACIVPTLPSDSCTEEDDAGVVRDFYIQVEYLKNTDCIRYLETV